MSLELLDNIPWRSLNGAHARFSAGSDTARRYGPGFAPILGFRDPSRADWDALAAHCETDEHFYSSGESSAPPEGWTVEIDARLMQMVWSGPEPAANDATEIVALGPEHVPQMIELIALTRPGPFGPRTPELGEYIGVIESGRLIAMAGERMTAGKLVEISGVCTHPDDQGRGLALLLMQTLLRSELRRGAWPFLHVMTDNHRARAIYERLGFKPHQELPLRVVSRG